MRPQRRRLDPNTVQLLKHIGVGFVVIVVVALLIAAVWYGTRISALTITEIDASGGETIKPDQVEQLVKKILEGTYLGLIPRRFAWLYPEQEIVETVSKTERIFNVVVVRDSGTKLQITYDEYVPFALWCRSTTDEECLFLNSEGYAFGKAPKLTGGSFLRFVTAGREPVVGEIVAESGVYKNAQELVRLLAEENWFISHVELDQVGDIFLSVVEGGELKINFGETPVQLIQNLQVLFASDEFKHLEPGNFQYIDLRFGNKVFVNEEQILEKEEIPNEQSTTTVQALVE